MCIRDRGQAVQLLGHLPQRAGGLDDLPDGALQLVEEAVEPVSYTHLRAHETVLDLVCRLLLEKKKQKVYKLLITA